METKRTDRPEAVQVRTEKDVDALLDKNRFSAEDISAIKTFCTEDMNVSEKLKKRMEGSEAFVLALIKNSYTLSARECSVVFGLYHSTETESVRKAIENELVIQNKNLAYKIALKAKAMCKIEYEDLAQESLLHLFEAIHKYDPSFNAKFSSFAFKHISGELFRYIEKTQSLMKVPNEKQRMYRKYKAFEKKYVLTHPNATDKEIAQAVMESLEYTEKDIRNIAVIQQFSSPEYMDADIWDNSAHLKDYIKDENAETDFGEVLDSCFCEELKEFLRKALPPKQYKVIVEYYGLDGNEPKTFQEIDKQRENLKGRPGPAAALKHTKAIDKLRTNHMTKLKEFAKDIA